MGVVRALVCRLVGHRWHWLRVGQPCASNLVHLHLAAACDADCLRCGKQWRDFAFHERVCGAVDVIAVAEGGAA